MLIANLIFMCKDQTGEAATWLPGFGLFLWLDIDNGVLHQYDPISREVTDHQFPEMITSIIPWKDHDDEILLTMKNRVVAYHLKQRTWFTLVELKNLLPQWRTNDCKASPAGRLWCGIMHMSQHNGNGSLLCLDNDLSLNSVLKGQSIPNGIVWNAEGIRLYYADSGRSCIEEYGYDRLTGAIYLIKTAVQIPEEMGVPDGMTIDSEGRLWVAHWGGFGVYVWNPATGELVDKVDVPVPNVASCTFGGKNGRTLFITTARDGLSEAELERYPQSGSLFAVEVLAEVHPGQNHYPFISLKTIK